ncbi:hypothetical protein DYB32_000727 [Aphanomyces invadans]|uniref:Helicase C-terminal domain-containing protein n=1 Tax=Aphanomyces invadans TaxID=157072 RepID=A0A3R6VTI3_9STRA|nr:hypothetical protein DYB32_000727 [Aphanomyces invadans]
MLLFQRALQTTSLDLTNVPEFEAPIGNKRSKSADPSSPSIPFQTSAIPYLNTLMQTSYYDGQVVHIETIPTRPARFGHRQLSDLGVCDAVRQAVLVDKLYSHQSDAIAALLEGQHVVISTSTSSGKSMVYSIPVAHSLVTSQATSLFLFPTKGRKLTELILDYTHSILRSQKLGHLVARVKGYRGGYSVESRRAIETQLFRQELLGVVATNALELGIDIGSLECTLHLGFPPSIASMWQQAGLIVCFDSPLDAYNTSLGSAMFHKLPEAVVLDPNNSQVVQQHLLCASLELDLLSQRCGTNAIDRQGREYLITKVDTDAKIILAKPCATRLKYYTTCRDFTDVDVMTTFLPSLAYSSQVHLGIAHSTTHVVGCYALEKRTQRILHRTDFSLPPMESEGHAVWMDIPVHVGNVGEPLADSERHPTRDALHGVNHLILAVNPHFMLVDSKDLATEHVSPLEKRIRYGHRSAFQASIRRDY